MIRNNKNIHHNFSLKEWFEKVEETNGKCPLCEQDYSKVWPYTSTMDHIIPVSKVPDGFIYNIDDVQPMCHSCNASKGEKLFKEDTRFLLGVLTVNF